MTDSEDIKAILEEIRDDQREHFKYVRQLLDEDRKLAAEARQSLEEDRKQAAEARKHQITAVNTQEYFMRLYEIDRGRGVLMKTVQLVCYILIFGVLLFMACFPP